MAWRCGDVAWADLDPSAGHEQAKRRPVIVVSNDKFNRHSTLTMVVPITSSDTAYPLHLDVGPVPSEDGSSPVRGYAEAEQLKALDLQARNAAKVGTIDEAGMDKLLGLILGCLITPDMSIITAY